MFCNVKYMVFKIKILFIAVSFIWKLSYTSLCFLKLFAVLYGWRQFKQQKSPSYIDVIPLRNDYNLLQQDNAIFHYQ